MGGLVAVQIYRGDLHLLDGDLTAGGIQEYVDLILVAFPLHFQHHGDAGYGKGPQPRLGIVHGHPGGHPEIKRVIALPKRLRKGTLPVNRREPSTKASGFCRQARHTASMSAGRCWPSASTVTTPSWGGKWAAMYSQAVLMARPFPRFPDAAAGSPPREAGQISAGPPGNCHRPPPPGYTPAKAERLPGARAFHPVHRQVSMRSWAYSFVFHNLVSGAISGRRRRACLVKVQYSLGK